MEPSVDTRSWKVHDRVEKHIKTSEDWYPTAPDGTVRVLFTLLSNNMWRVAVWGDDDFGLERDFPRVERQEARRLYERLTDYTTQVQMTNWGMERA